MDLRLLPTLLAALALAVAASPARAQTDATRASPGDLMPRLERVRTDPRLAEAAIRTGRKVAAVCALCHGDAGVSSRPDVPNLAGQNPGYLLEQMRQFAEGRRRNEFMEGMIKATSIDERIGAVLYYAGQQVPPRPPLNAALAARGRDLYGRNCFRCHGAEGHGDAQFARVAGQQPEYMSATLKRYRAGTGVRINPLMADGTRLLGDADIEALVAFVGAMP